VTSRLGRRVRNTHLTASSFAKAAAGRAEYVYGFVSDLAVMKKNISQESRNAGTEIQFLS
jgi:hypothetical protein